MHFGVPETCHAPHAVFGKLSYWLDVDWFVNKILNSMEDGALVSLNKKAGKLTFDDLYRVSYDHRHIHKTGVYWLGIESAVGTRYSYVGSSLSIYGV
jgi:hypothetical protein